LGFAFTDNSGTLAGMTDTPPPQEPLLWHYTSFAGLHGIVTKGDLFASSLAYLNDTEEFQYTIKVLLKLIEEGRLAPRNTLRDVGRFTVAQVVQRIFDSPRAQPLFITCFSKERDDLSQWRSYTPHPPGFAIGFQRDDLISVAELKHFTVIECDYPTKAQLFAEVKAALDASTVGMDAERDALPSNASSQDVEDFVDKWAFTIVQAILDIAPKNKHPKFKAENEVRLLGHVSPTIGANADLPIEYRLSGSLVVPYVRIPNRLPEGPSPIKEILVGPCPHQEAVIAATRQMCWQHDIRPEVNASGVPYRNW
jgi:hypothetical protein